MYIALDGMGGDYAPLCNIKGAIEFASETKIGVYLVGKKDILLQEIKKHNLSIEGLPIEIVDAPETIQMHESPSVALRKKKKFIYAYCWETCQGRKSSGFCLCWEYWSCDEYW